MLTSFDPGVWLRMDPYVEGRYSSLEVSLRDVDRFNIILSEKITRTVPSIEP